jgi:RNA polymerase sigma-70 factor (ECF subfamily)
MTTDWSKLFSRIRAALMRRGRSEQDADDIVQEAWIRLDCYEKYQSVDRPEAFLMRTALNLSIDAHRAYASRGEEVFLEDVILIDSSPSAADVVLARERVARLSLCLARLSETTRDIFIAHRIDGQSYREIAERRGLSISTVEKHVARATLNVTTWMEGY